MMSTVAEWFRRLTCGASGHRFVVFSDGYKRRCTRCGREEWIFGNPYPRVGQPAHEWKMVWKDGPREIPKDKDQCDDHQ